MLDQLLNNYLQRWAHSLCRCKFTVAQVPWVTLESRVVLVVVTSSLLVARARFGLGVLSVAGVRRGALDGLTARRCATLRLLVGADSPVVGLDGGHRLGW